MISHDCLIFGAGGHARKLAKALQAEGHQVHAFVTSRPASTDELDGIPIHSFASLPDQLHTIGPIACGVFNRGDDYQGLSEMLINNGFDKILWPWDYYPALHQQLGWCYWLDPEPRDLQRWQKDPRFQELMKLLADDESRLIIQRMIAFRSGSDLAFSAFKSSELQYFNHLTLRSLPRNRPISYLDVGAYNGDTLEHLCAKAMVGTAILLEPDPSNFRALTQNTRKLAGQYPQLRPLVLPLGAGSQSGYASLEVGGEASSLHIQSQGQTTDAYTVTVTPLDDILPVEHIDFIKIDVEGHDRDAIQGMLGILDRSRPVIAVSLYHRPHDFAELTIEISQVLKEAPYSFYVRQHLYNSFETVLYAVPQHDSFEG
ncbi:MAG: FkbM family methyltransferase [Cyanobium sp.]